jgi:hypothetical protein
MLNPGMPTFEGETVWISRGDGAEQGLHIVCRLRSPENIMLELTVGSWKYEAWLTQTTGDLYRGVYEVRKGGKLLRGTITCSLERIDGSVQVKGTVEEGGIHYDWKGRLPQV